MIGTNLQNRWNIVELLSDSGGNGQVWRGKNLKADVAAIKILRVIEETDKNERRKARFENEIKKLKYIQDLKIESVMPLIDHGYTDDGRPWYSMPIAQPLLVPQEFKARIELLLLLSDIVANLHNKGIEHRDLKPNNLLMLDGKLTVCDFGLARTDDDDHLTMTGERVGSVGYTALECVGRSDQPRFECDVYALSKVAWVILSGQDSPPHGELKSPDDDLYSYWPDVEPDTIAQFQSIVFAAAQRNPQARPTARQLGDGLGLLISETQNEKNTSKSKPADRARSLFAEHAETNQRITDVQGILGNLYHKNSNQWFDSWTDTVQAIGWGKSRISGGGSILYRMLSGGWKQGPRYFSKGSIDGADFEISLTFKFKEPDGKNRVEIGFAIAIEIPSLDKAFLIVEKEYDSYTTGPQLTNLEKELLSEITSDKYQYVTIERLNEIVKS